MIRKAIQANTTTLVVTLPKKWVKINKVEKGDDLFVDEREGNLTVQANYKKVDSSTSMHIQNASVLRSAIGSAFRAGFSKIELVFDKEVDLTAINEALDSFIGLEIASYNTQKAVLRVLSSPEKDEFDFYVNKIFMGIKIMVENILNYFQEKECSFKDINDLRKGNLKAREWCMRAINTLGVAKRIGEHYTFLHILEKISGALWHIGQYLKAHRIKPSKTLVVLMKEEQDLIVQLHRMVMKKDPSLGLKILEDRFLLRESYFKKDGLIGLFNKKDVDPVVISLLVRIRMDISAVVTRYLAFSS